MNDKKLLIVFSPLYPPHIGGLESHAFQFNEHIAKKNADIVVFTPLVTPNTPLEEQQASNISILRFPAFEIIPNFPVPKIWHPTFWHQLKKVRRRAKQHKEHGTVISRTRFFLTSVLTLVFSKLHGYRWMHIEHGSDFVHLHNPFFSLLARIYDHTLGRLVFLVADIVVANSQASRTFVQIFAPNKKVHVIYRGVESAALEAIKAEDFRTDDVIITYVGRLIDGKGVSDLIYAFKNLENKKAKLYIVGDGSQRNHLASLAKTLGIDSQVKFFDAAGWKKAIAIMKGSNIIVNPSYTEGLPTSVIEAALCKKAIVATNVGGTPEIIKDHVSGLLFPPKDIDALTMHLNDLMNHPEKRLQLSTEAYRSVKEMFSWDRSIAQYQELLS